MTRRYSDIPLPETRYQPGISPRSVRQRSKGWLESLQKPARLDRAAWQKSLHYRYAIDLFNGQYWWEAHEVLEGLWVKAGRRDDLALFLQGLIQVCAALLKKSQGIEEGARSLAARGVPKIAAHSGIFLGVHVENLVQAIQSYIADQTETPPLIVLIDTQ